MRFTGWFTGCRGWFHGFCVGSTRTFLRYHVGYAHVTDCYRFILRLHCAYGCCHTTPVTVVWVLPTFTVAARLDTPRFSYARLVTFTLGCGYRLRCGYPVCRCGSLPHVYCRLPRGLPATHVITVLTVTHHATVTFFAGYGCWIRVYCRSPHVPVTGLVGWMPHRLRLVGFGWLRVHRLPVYTAGYVGWFTHHTRYTRLRLRLHTIRSVTGLRSALRFVLHTLDCYLVGFRFTTHGCSLTRCPDFAFTAHTHGCRTFTVLPRLRLPRGYVYPGYGLVTLRTHYARVGFTFVAGYVTTRLVGWLLHTTVTVHRLPRCTVTTHARLPHGYLVTLPCGYPVTVTRGHAVTPGTVTHLQLPPQFCLQFTQFWLGYTHTHTPVTLRGCTHARLPAARLPAVMRLHVRHTTLCLRFVTDCVPVPTRLLPFSSLPVTQFPHGWVPRCTVYARYGWFLVYTTYHAVMPVTLPIRSGYRFWMPFARLRGLPHVCTHARLHTFAFLCVLIYVGVYTH